MQRQFPWGASEGNDVKGYNAWRKLPIVEEDVELRLEPPRHHPLKKRPIVEEPLHPVIGFLFGMFTGATIATFWYIIYWY